MNANQLQKKARLSYTQLKKNIDPSSFPFETTSEISTLDGIIGQQRGSQAMKFGLNVKKKGYNIYVAGITGTGKTSFTNSIVKEVAKKDTTLYDWCYVYNFQDKYKPKILKLPAGFGKQLQEDMDEFVQNLKTDLPRAFNEENYQKERASIIRSSQEKSNNIFKELNDIAKQYGFMIRQSGSGFITIPVLHGKPLSEEEYNQLDETQLEKLEEKSALLQEKVLEFTNKLRSLEKDLTKTIESLDQKIALSVVDFHLGELEEKYQHCNGVLDYFEEAKQDILHHLEDFLEDKKDSNNPFQQMLGRNHGNDVTHKYQVNLFVDNSQTKGAPVVTADNPTYYNLIGKVEYENKMGVMSTDFTKIKPGYLHQANGGYLIIQVKDILTNHYAWDALKRALQNKNIQIENIGEQLGLVSTTSLSPDPIPLKVKVILIGSPAIYQLLYHYDEDFKKLFKIKADFDVEMDNNEENLYKLARFIQTKCEEDGLRPFDKEAVAKIAEYSIRLSDHQNKLSTRFNQQVEIIYEADTWAALMEDDIVQAKHVKKAIEEKKYRSNLYEEKLQESMEDGDILIDTKGEKIGQVNGLAVYQLGQYQFGKPSRITASTYVGQKGIVNIERESKMSGNIHNKGVYILGGYLGNTFAQKRPLALTAHLAFEQSYSGVDGDSASSTELYALLSSLAEVPIKQGLAVTGSVNQKGEIQPIGGVNEKIEGFFDVCKKEGLTGEQGVLIPHQNVKNLMLKDEVIEAVKNNQFHIYQVKTIEEGIELLTGMRAGKRKEDGEFEENTLYRKVSDKLKAFIAHAEKKKTEKENDDASS